MEHDVDINSYHTNLRESALHLAVRFEQFHILKLLIQCGGNANQICILFIFIFFFFKLFLKLFALHKAKRNQG